MGKSRKGGRGPGGAEPPNKHLYSRISFLYQAATHLLHDDVARKSQPEPPTAPVGAPVLTEPATNIPSLFGGPAAATAEANADAQDSANSNEQHSLKLPATATPTPSLALSRHLVTHLRSVSLKTQIRLAPDIKRSICKRCNALLIPGTTSAPRIENASRGGKKPWADVLVVECLACGTVKRFPVGARKRAKRNGKGAGDESAKEGEVAT